MTADQCTIKQGTKTNKTECDNISLVSPPLPSPATGFAGYSGSGQGSGYGSEGGSGIGGGIGSAFGGITNAAGSIIGAIGDTAGKTASSIFVYDSAKGIWGNIGASFGGAMFTGFAYALGSYFSQEKEAEYEVIERDLNMNWNNLKFLRVERELTAADQVREVPDTDLAYQLDANTNFFESSLVDKKLKVEFNQVTFINKKPIVTEPFSPVYRILQVNGDRHKYRGDRADSALQGGESSFIYDKDYFEILRKRSFFDFQIGVQEKPDVESKKLKETKAEPYSQRFHLMFSAVPAETNAQNIPGLLSCQSGTKVGRTGLEALPKIKYAWSWPEISPDFCDVDGKGYYCDATQFAIEVLQKTKSLQDYVEANGSGFECPLPFGGSSSNQNIVPPNDLGIEELTVSQLTRDSVKLSAKLHNTNTVRVKADYNFSAVNQDTGDTFDCTQGTRRVEVLSDETVSCDFSGLTDGTYQGIASIAPLIEDPATQANDSRTDELKLGFTIGPAGSVRECVPYSTERLEQFLSASSITGGQAQTVLKLVKFKANLMLDRFSTDFQHDFDDYSKTQSIFNAPSYYLQEPDGLGTYFRNENLFKFRSRFEEDNPEGFLARPGTYDVTINMVFKDGSWKLFDSAGNPNAVIEVLLEKVDVPEPDSPFYYAPIDGLLGSDGRVGYGTGFKGDIIFLNQGTAEAVRTVEQPGSVPV
ncbi:MAG: hypothetical protein HY917_01710, partial [Candidatus Diapherotrites archaeon]|nr:hypothetical protein [Candidatus Diapherotrites archaeon]